MIFSLPLVVDVLAKASILLALTALAAAALRRASASARHLVWALGLAGALIVPVLSTTMPRWEVPLITIAAPAVTTPASPAAADRAVRPHAGEAAAPVDSRSLRAGSGEPPDLSNRTAGLTWPSIALLVWLAGGTLLLCRLLLGFAAVSWMSRRLPNVGNGPWIALARDLARDLGLRRVRFVRGRAATMPMAWGIARATVVMPADADGWPSDRVRVVLLHELAHVKRRDCLTHLVAQVACAAYWFNPLVWMAAGRLRAERERACDDLVLAAGTRGSDYADQLLDIARVVEPGRFRTVLSGASLAMAHRSQLEGRLLAILDPRVPRRSLSRAGVGIAATAFALLLVPVASVQPWAEERTPVGADVRERAAEQAAQAQRLAHPETAPNAASIQAAARTVAQPAAGVEGGVAGGVAGGIVGGIAGGTVGGIATNITDGVSAVVGRIAPRAVDGSQARAPDQDKTRTIDPRAVNGLMEALADADQEVREAALHALVQLRDPRSFEPLLAALKDASADMREQAAFGLGQLGDRRAAEPLSASLKDGDAGVREQAAFALGQLKAASAIGPLAAALHDPADDVREQAAFALGQIRDPRAVEPLIPSLRDEKADVREQAAFALGQIRDPRAVEPLALALKDAAPDVREQAAFALGQIHDARAIDALTAALKDPNADVRKQAAFALGQIR